MHAAMGANVLSGIFYSGLKTYGKNLMEVAQVVESAYSHICFKKHVLHLQN